ncbi:MAG: MATE family efflux transporter [Erysipelotrichaceae bacterium]
MNKMKNTPVRKLLISMSLPIMLAMLIQALYNIVDSMFVANYAKEALDAVSLAFPISTLIISISVGTAVGMGAILSKRLGQGRQGEANQIAMHGIVLALASYAAIAIFGLFFAKSFASFFTSNQEVLEMATSYIRICTVGSFGVFVQITLERMLQSTGHTVENLMMQGSGALINIILDPLLIFGLFFFPELGVKGAAIATILGQISAMCIGLHLVHKKVKEIQLDFSTFKFDMNVVKEIYHVGFPAIVMQSLTSIMTVCLNVILALDSETAISVYSVYAKLQAFIFMPIFGMNNAMVAIVAYNYGARNKERILATMSLAIKITLVVMGCGTLLFQLLANPIMYLFNADAQMLSLGVVALRRISLCFIFAGVTIINSGVFQALGKGFYSLILSLSRNIIMLIPISYLLYLLLGIDGLWYSFILAEFICMLIGLKMMSKIKKTVIDQL